MKIVSTIQKPKMNEREIASALLFVSFVAGGDDVVSAYTKGQIAERARPIIEMIKELADPICYGTLIWAFIRYMLNQRAEALLMVRSTVWGYCGVQMAPFLMEFVKDVTSVSAKS